MENPDVPNLSNLIESVFSEMNLGLLIYRLEKANDANSLKLIYVNREASKFTGADLQQHVGKYILQAFPSLKETELPAAYAEIAVTKRAQKIGLVEYADQKLNKGSYSVWAFPIPDDCVGVVFEDIRVRKQIDEMVKKKTEEQEQEIEALRETVSSTAEELTAKLNELKTSIAEIRKTDPSDLIKDQTEALIATTDAALKRVNELNEQVS